MSDASQPGKPPRGLGTRVLDVLLKPAGVRRRVAFHLKQEHFIELGFRVPIGGGLNAPIHAHENLYSFGEIFGAHEYGGLWQHIPVPRRWLDLGAHAGYFTLSVAAQHAMAGNARDWRAVLVEPDPRMRPVIEDGINANGLGANIRLLQGLLGGGEKESSFTLRDGMLSSAHAGDAAGGTAIAVPTITEAAILATLPAPYDLVKIDIEGAEYDFVRAYPQICRGARALVLEWHAPTERDARREELAQTLRAHGLTRCATLRAASHGGAGGALAWSGLELYLRENAI